jgi:hypothetical protein
LLIERGWIVRLDQLNRHPLRGKVWRLQCGMIYSYGCTGKGERERERERERENEHPRGMVLDHT